MEQASRPQFNPNPLNADTMTIETLTGLLVVITGVYAWLTYRVARANEDSVRLMREQFESAHRPYVEITVSTTPGSPVFYLRIRNTGRIPAARLRLELDKDFYQYGERTGQNLRSFTAFTQEIEMFPPSAELVFGLAQGFVVFGENADPALTPSVFSISAAYSYGTKKVNETTTLDLRPYLSTLVGRDALSDGLNELKSQLQRLTDAVRSLDRSASDRLLK